LFAVRAVGRSILGSHSHRRSSQSDAAVPCCAVLGCAQQPRRAQRTTAAASLARLLPHTAQHKHGAIPFQRQWRAGLPLGRSGHCTVGSSPQLTRRCGFVSDRSACSAVSPTRVGTAEVSGACGTTFSVLGAWAVSRVRSHFGAGVQLDLEPRVVFVVSAQARRSLPPLSGSAKMNMPIAVVIA
jgi:hypothetical protein